MKVNGGRPTSPKASRGKAGIRQDIDPSTYFYSRWEANMARLYTYLDIPWLFTPHSFDIGNQIYTPDFYLPEIETYVEVKNFWSEYSRTRDSKFRSTHPQIALQVILKEEYTALENQYAKCIPNWEYKNSPF
jgi:predicted nuclease of restriction endonuclease-like RecB superfamily